MEAALALLYLLPRPRGDGLRHLALLAFCAVTYALAPVAGFGWLLLVMGLANAEPRRHRLRRVYVAAFLLVLVYAEVPWADAALRLFPTPPD
jgi:hypothetical protein